MTFSVIKYLPVFSFLLSYFWFYTPYNIQSNFSQIFKQSEVSKYKEIFGNDYDEALKYFKENSTKQKIIFRNNKIDARIVIPVIFPERIRYSIIQDYFETKFLETVYIDYGSGYIDFSIGDFQMKPTFVEKLENEISENSELSIKYKSLLIQEHDSVLQRKERIKRLQSSYFQLNYVSAFYDIVNLKFDLKEMSLEEKIKFFASAYNFGFDKSKSEILKQIDNVSFPYGAKYPMTQYAYTDVALDFYLNYYSSIFS